MPLGDDMMATLNHEISKSARNSEQLHMFARLLDWTIPILAFAGGIGTLTKSPQTILLGSAALAAAFLSAIRTAFNPRSKAVDAEAAKVECECFRRELWGGIDRIVDESRAGGGGGSEREKTARIAFFEAKRVAFDALMRKLKH